MLGLEALYEPAYCECGVLVVLGLECSELGGGGGERVPRLVFGPFVQNEPEWSNSSFGCDRHKAYL